MTKEFVDILYKEMAKFKQNKDDFIEVIVHNCP